MKTVPAKENSTWEKAGVSRSMRSRRGRIKMKSKGHDCPEDSEIKRKGKIDTLR